MIMAVQLAQRPSVLFCQNVPQEPVLTSLQTENSNLNTSKPFLSSLLNSTPFATLFNPVAIDSVKTTERKRSSTTDLLLDNSNSDVSVTSATTNGNNNDAAISDSIGSLGLKMLNSLKFKTKSFMDLPSLWSSSDFSKDNTYSSTALPSSPMLHSGTANSSPINSVPTSPTSSRKLSNLRQSSTSCVEESDENGQELSLKYLTYPLLKIAVENFKNSLKETEANVEVKVMTDQDTDNPSLFVDRDKLNDSTFLINTLRSTFSSSEALNNSFMYPSKDSDKFDHTSNPFGIDIQAVRDSYDLILELSSHETVLMTFVNAQEILLAKLQLNLKRLQYGDPKMLRQLIILLENPLLQDKSYQESLLKKLCIVIGGLKSKSRAVLKSWLTAYDQDGLGRIVKIFQQYFDDHYYAGPNSDEALIASVKVLSLLYHANEASKPKLLKINCFYSDSLCRKLNFKDEYKIWKRTQQPPKTGHIPRSHSMPNINGFPEFSYFNFPFLFDPVAKTRILHIDAMTQMSLEFEDAFVHQALVIHAHKFLQDSASVATIEQELERKTNPYLLLEVRRSKLVDDVLDQITRKQADLKKPLKVKFVGEEGQDAGGVQKEFFQNLIGYLMSPTYGMFVYDEDTRFVWINGASLESERQYELIGTVLGLALYNGVILGINFPMIVYKKLLDEEIDLEDLKQGFPVLGRGLQQLLDWDDGDVADVFFRSFEISYDVYGHVKTFPLVANGSDIPVTNENRKKFVKLYINHFVNESTKRQFSAFRRGFHKVCGGPALKMCRPEELELLICGTTTTNMDFKLLEEATKYEEFSPDDKLIVGFWKIVHEDFDLEMKKKLLNFVTSSDRVPLKGLGNLTFKIQKNGGDTDRLPTSAVKK
ncbi:hypothetical protein HK099_005037 [Clydaea vesicula]|uniref:HECT-type E3 ubiquitin transferase n=1 Tax=Clydaea vesicula TaxID=447962 RepID=A0AAD5U496_9FUNG|nr:hypothetical protein HK099_005037 [Clydaea vesicula]